MNQRNRRGVARRVSVWSTAGGVATIVAAVALIAAPVRSHAQGTEPACNPDTHPAISFWRLPARVRWGREYVFGFAGDELAVTAPIQVRMASPPGSRPFFSGKVPDDLSGRLFIELDRGDAPAVVTASYPEEDINGAVCSRTLNATVRGSDGAAVQHIFFDTNCRSPRYRPTRIIIACGDGNLYVTGIHWRGWNGSRASGTGVGHYNDCTPFCAVGHFHTQAITVRAYRPIYCTDAEKWQYSRLAYNFVGSGDLRADRGIRFPCGAL